MPPLTHRDHAQSVRFVTGHLQQHGEMEWGKLAAEQQTLVFYMGLSRGRNSAAAVTARMDAAMPVAIVQHGTTPQQRVACATLQELATLAQQFASPALIIGAAWSPAHAAALVLMR